MNHLFAYISAENYKFFKSNLWKISLLIATLISLFMISAIQKNSNWQADLAKRNKDIELQLNQTPLTLKNSVTENYLIQEWQENNAYLNEQVKPATEGTIQGYLSSVLSLKGLGLILVVFTILFSVNLAKEFETGTIKFMLMSPYTRVKLIIGNYLTVLLVSFLFLFAVLVVNSLLSFAFMSPSSTTHFTSLYGEIISSSTLAFMFKNILLSLVYYFVYITFTFMLASVFRSVMLSLSVSLLFALLGTQIMGLISVHPKILQFLLPAIVDLTNYQGGTTLIQQNNYSILTCLSIITIYISVFLCISIVSFKYRDI